MSSSLPVASALISTLAWIIGTLIGLVLAVAVWMLTHLPADVLVTGAILGAIAWVFLIKLPLAVNKAIPGVIPYLLGRHQGRKLITHNGNGRSNGNGNGHGRELGRELPKD